MADRSSRRRRPGSDRTRGAVASAGLLLLTACGGSGPVEIDSPDLPARARTACQSLVASLPKRLADQPTRAVTPTDALGAAWGDPAITLTCGVGVPSGFNRLSGCTQVDGVGWFVPPGATSGEEDATFTAVGYRPRVALHVPSDYLPEGGAAALAELAAPVRKHLRLADRCV